MAPPRLAIVVSHPIQHFVPLYRALAKESDLALRIIYCARIGLKSYYDAEMKTTLSWAMDLLGGYEHEFLPEASSIETASFRTINNPSVGKALSRFRPDAVLIYGWAQMTALRAFAWCRLRGVPRLVTGDSELLQDRSAARKLAKTVVLRGLLSQCSAVLTVGDNNEAFYRHYGVPPEKMFRAPFTIDEPLYLAARAARARLRAEFRTRHGIPPDAVCALFVGKLSERKRPLDLIEAVARLNSRGERLHCIIAGAGELTEVVQRRAQNIGTPAILLGFVNVDCLPEVYASADVLVHPSSADPHPLVMSEATCMSLPIVLSDRVGAAGPTDIARPGINAIVYPCGDVEALAAALHEAVDAERRAHMSAAALEVWSDQDVRRTIAGVKTAVAYAIRRKGP